MKKNIVRTKKPNVTQRNKFKKADFKDIVKVAGKKYVRKQTVNLLNKSKEKAIDKLEESESLENQIIKDNINFINKIKSTTENVDIAINTAKNSVKLGKKSE